jgi:hypothetical protein
VLDSHINSVASFYWDDEKKLLITASHDKSIKMYQFPIFWPSEIIRKYKNKNKVTIIKEKEKILPPSDDTNTITDNNTHSELEKENTIITEESLPIEEKPAKILIKREMENLPDLTEREINCLDLDGWDSVQISE